MAALRCRGVVLEWSWLESHRLGWCSALGLAWKSEWRLRISSSWRGAGIGLVGGMLVASLVRNLGASVDVGAVAPSMIVGCRLRLLG